MGVKVSRLREGGVRRRVGRLRVGVTQGAGLSEVKEERADVRTQRAKPIGRQHRYRSTDTQHRRAAKVVVKRSHPFLVSTFTPFLVSRPRGGTQLTHMALLK